MTVPSECLKGRVWWNYPRGTLEVQFHQPKLFTVCLEPSLGPFLSSVSQVDGNGKEISINLRPDGELNACMNTEELLFLKDKL